jgi:serralysin
MHFCTASYLKDPEAQWRATALAIEENDANHPAPQDLAFAIEMLGRIGAPDPEKSALVATSSRLWRPGREIRVHFMEGGRYPEARDEVLKHMRQWSKHANLDFVREKNRKASDVRITFNSGGSWSYIGTGVLAIDKDRPTMQLGWYLRERRGGVVIHETGHTNGFQHEQGSPARDCQYNRQAVIRDLSGPPNNWDLGTIEHNVFNRSTSTQYSEYDPKSCMHYFEPASWFYDPSCAVTSPNETLSETDRKYSRLWYPGR